MGKLINFDIYTPVEVIFFSICCIIWLIVYIIVLINIRKKKEVEIPVAAVVGNVAWEFLWSWVYHTNMGELFQWGYRIWFFLDLFILYSVFKYGSKQYLNINYKKYFVPSTILGLAIWLIGLYYFIPEHDTDGMGLFSAYILNVYMSSLYCFQIIRQPEFAISKYTGWLKMLGTGAVSIMAYLHFGSIPGYQTVISLCIFSFVLDAIYIWLQYKNNIQKVAIVTNNS